MKAAAHYIISFLIGFYVLSSNVLFAENTLKDNDDGPLTTLESESDESVEYEDIDESAEQEVEDQSIQELKIADIIIEGNKHVPLEPILNAIPFQPGEVFIPQRTNKLIHNVYQLGYFRQIRVFTQKVDPTHINLIVSLEEKPLLEGVIFHGNKHLSEKEIKKKLDFTKIPAIDQDDIPKYIKILKRLYREKDYHNVDIKAELKGSEERATLIFIINEGKQTLVKRVCFTGNNHFRSKQLRSLLFTREDWILGFIDRAGSYQQEAIEADKYVIENYYQSNGFFTAKVTDVTTDIDPINQGAIITFHIHEGDIYYVGDLHVSGGTELFSEQELLAMLPLQPGQVYSKERIRETIELLRLLFGNYGYVHADIEPAIQPNEDEKTVSIRFYIELGPKIYVNRINIIGHQKTHDKVIRRQLRIQEGSLLTTKALDESKARVEGLGYFDTRDGVNWRINRVAPDKVDLDLIVKEIKTGRFEAQFGFGGSMQDISSPSESFNVGASLSESNFLGRGMLVNASATFAKEERNFTFNFTDPWLFDRPIHASTDLYFKRSLYDTFKLIQQEAIYERITGGAVSMGALSAKLNDATVSAKLGIDGITYVETPRVRTDFIAIAPQEAQELQEILNRRFTSGAFIWISGYAFKDMRNHPIHPSRGYQWIANSKFALHSNLKDNPQDSPVRTLEIEPERVRFGYAKFDFDASWYTPLIGERDLVLCLHGHLGLVAPFKNRSIPFRELYHVGGPTSTRGFLFGEIGPTYFSPRLNERDMIGAKKAFWLNAEMVFPISSDFSMKGAVFYDGGAGWDTPDAFLVSPANLKNNSFAFRHSVGFGIRVLRPTPVKIDWGFKLDRKKGESPSEVHFSMYHEF